MAVLKKIKFGELAHNIQFTEVKPASGGVITATPAHTDENDENNPEYVVDLTIADDGTLVKDNGALKVGTVPATRVSVDNTTAGITATTAQAAFKELKDEIDAVDGAAKSYKIVSVAEPASTSQAEYKIQEKIGDGNWADVTGSSAIIVPKDNAFVTAQLGHTGATVNQTTGAITDGPSTGAEVLLIEYKNGEGAYTLVEIPVDDFLRESEFKDGLVVNNSGEVRVKIDETSETFLTVSADGVKLAGVQDAIDAKVAELDFTTDAAVAGQYVAAIEETDGVVGVKTRANVSEAVLNNYAKGSDATAVAATDTVNQAISKLENQVDAAKAAASAAHSVVEKDTNASHLTVTASQPDTSTGAITYTIGETNIADADDLADEITRAQNAEGEIAGLVGLGGTEGSRTFTPTTNYGGNSASVVANLQALDTQVKANADALAAVQYKVDGTTLEFFGMTAHA